jgi:DNA polymerase III alpha subunit (gram-positive type)
MSGGFNYTIPMRSRDLVFVDCETTGLDHHVHEIIEWAAIRMSPDLQIERGRVDMRCVMQWPERAEKEALEINGYSREAWFDAKPIRLMLFEHGKLIEDGEALTVGHNARFDLDFLEEAYRRESMTMPRMKYVLDTASMAWPLVVHGHLEWLRLETMCSKYGVTNDGKHRALADVMRMIRVYAKLVGVKEPRFGRRIEDNEPEWAR